MKGLAIANICIIGLAWIGMVLNIADGQGSSSAVWGFILTIPMMLFAILYLALKK